MNSIDDYNSYEEYMMYEICWKCKKNKIAFDTGLYQFVGIVMDIKSK